MHSISHAVANIALFAVVYVEVFFLVTFLEKRKTMKFRVGPFDLKSFPTVTVVVPCLNEQNTIAGTAQSLLDLDYPKDKIKIILVDDGSTDDTWKIMQGFKNEPNVELIHHEKNGGGKHVPLNAGLARADGEFFACLDADSYVKPDTLTRLLSYFEEHPQCMAVAPSVVTIEPNKFVERAQNAEYMISVYLKKMAGFMGGIHVLPGPFSLFRKRVFEEIGAYSHGHGTEDMEIAFRMQKNHYSIDHCPDAVVYTKTPDTIKKLYKQRTRWVYGFIQLAIEYRRMLFRKKYGNFAIFTLPAGIISIVAAVYLFLYLFYNIFSYIIHKIYEWSVVGLSSEVFSNFSIDWFYINTESILFLTVILYILLLFAMIIGRRLSAGKTGSSFNIILYFIIYSLVAPFWVMKAFLNTTLMKKTKWR
jgi:cellulose synthase/poly-beta-1,6-N-acetylglucosamine synthase-like glycosyltransferase